MSMVASYSTLLEILGKKFFGIRTGFSSDQTDDLEDLMQHGLRDVYAAHDWSFFKPIQDISTTAPYATGTITIAAGVVTLTGGTWPSSAADGILKSGDNYYSVASRGSNSQITLDDTSVTDATAGSYQLAFPEVALDSDFEAIANDSDLTYYPDQNDLYPPVKQRHDKAIRTAQQNNPYFDRPIFYSVRTVEFDPTVGSRKRLAFYPTPDAAYILRVPMILRPTMITAVNLYPVGGETLAQVITEACLAAGERLLDHNGNGLHAQEFQKLLPLAIAADLEKSAPTSLGPDCPRGEGYFSGVYDSEYWARSARIGDLTLDGDTL